MSSAMYFPTQQAQAFRGQMPTGFAPQRGGIGGGMGMINPNMLVLLAAQQRQRQQGMLGGMPQGYQPQPQMPGGYSGIGGPVQPFSNAMSVPQLQQQQQAAIAQRMAQLGGVPSVPSQPQGIGGGMGAGMFPGLMQQAGGRGRQRKNRRGQPLYQQPNAIGGNQSFGNPYAALMGGGAGIAGSVGMAGAGMY